MKKLILLSAGTLSLAFIGACVAFGSNEPVSMNAEGETSTETSSVDSSSYSSSVADSSAASSEEEHWYNEALSWIDNKIVPLLGSVSLVSIVGMVTAIATALSKHKGDKTTQVVIKNQDDKITALNASIEEHEKYEKEMLEQYTVTLGKTAENVTLISNYAKTMADLVAEQNGQIEKVEKMKNSIEVSCELIQKSIALSDVAVKSGIASDAKKLVDNLKEVSANGE